MHPRTSEARDSVEDRGVDMWCPDGGSRGYVCRPPAGGPAGALEDELRPQKAQLGGVEPLLWACAVWARVCSCGIMLIRLED